MTGKITSIHYFVCLRMSTNTTPEISVKSLSVLSLGMFVASLGIALISSTGLGTTPISSLPFVAAEVFQLSFGTTTFFFNFALILLQLALLRKRFSRLNWLQLPLAFVFSAFLDFWMFALSALPLTSSYWISLLFSMIGNAILGLGIVLEIRSKSVPLSGEAFVLALSIVSHKPFPSMKIANDVSLVCLACALSLVALGCFYGVREGTVLSALTVGIFVKVFSGLLEKR